MASPALEVVAKFSSVAGDMVLRVQQKDMKPYMPATRGARVPWCALGFCPSTDYYGEFALRGPSAYVFGQWIDNGDGKFAWPEARLSVVLTNGMVPTTDPLSYKPATVAGFVTIDVTIDGVTTTPVAARPITIEDGGFEVFDVAGAERPYVGTLASEERILRHLPDPGPARDAVCHLCESGHAFDDTPFTTPDVPQASSTRIVHHTWPGSVDAVVRKDKATEARDASIAFTNFQGKRPQLYHFANGDLVRADFWRKLGCRVDEFGIKKSSTYVRFSASAYALTDNEHLAARRIVAAAEWWCYPVAFMVLDAYTEAIMSRNEVGGDTRWRNQRMPGYILSTLADADRVMGQHRPALAEGMRRVVQGGIAAGGDAFGFPYPSRIDYHLGKPSHGWPSIDDARLYFAVHGWGASFDPKWTDAEQAIPTLQNLATTAKPVALHKDTYTIREGGLWDVRRPWVVWWTAIALRGVCEAAERLGYDVVRKLLRHLVECLTVTARAPGRDDLGNDVVPVTVVDARSALWPSRLVKVYSDFGSTTGWIVPGLLMAAGLIVETDAESVKLRDDAVSLAQLIHSKCPEARIDIPHTEAVTTHLIAARPFGLKYKNPQQAMLAPAPPPLDPL